MLIRNRYSTVYLTRYIFDVGFRVDRCNCERFRASARSQRSTREIAIYLTAGYDTGRIIIRHPSHYCDKLIASRGECGIPRVNFPAGTKVLPDVSIGRCVYPRSLRLDNAPLACYNGGRRASRRPEKRLDCNKIAATLRATGFAKLFLAASEAREIRSSGELQSNF